jgi:hypothetical protein
MHQLTCAVGTVVRGIVGPLIVIEGVLNVGKLENIELPGNERSGAELISREDKVGKDVPLNVKSGEVIEAKEEIVGRLALKEVPLNVRSDNVIEAKEEIVGRVMLGKDWLKSRLDKLVVSPSAGSLVRMPPGVIVGGLVKLGAVRLAERADNDKSIVAVVDGSGPVVTRSDGAEGNDTLVVGSTFEDTVGIETSLAGDSVGIFEPRSEVPSEVTPGRLERPDVGMLAEGASGRKSDTL